MDNKTHDAALRHDNWLANIRERMRAAGGPQHRAEGEPRTDLSWTSGKHRA